MKLFLIITVGVLLFIGLNYYFDSSVSQAREVQSPPVIESVEKLTYVYNADKDLASQLKDLYLKNFKPDEYPCNLCQKTFGLLFMKSNWRLYVDQLEKEYEVEFVYRNNFKASDSTFSNTELPILIAETNDRQQLLLVDSVEMNNAKSIADFIELTNQALSNLESKDVQE